MSIKIKLDPEAWRTDLFDGLKAASSNKKRSLGTAFVGLFSFFLMVFSASPEYSTQMLLAGTQYWEIAFITRFSGMYATSGLVGISLTLIFSALVGITMTNTLVQLRGNKLSLDAIGALPGFLAGGCASCGVGVLSLLGFGGVLASLPFQGNLLRLGGISLLVALVVRTGDPDLCKI